MSFKRNVIASYVSQIYVIIVGILVLPMYLKYMGEEAYGLVGFFAMLQAWFNLLDVGLTPTIARETARFKSGAITKFDYRSLIRVLELIFLTIAILGGCIILAFSGIIADRWLNIKTLPVQDIKSAICFMAFGVALRWMSGLYRGCIAGSEQLVWLGGFNAYIATLRFILVLPMLALVGSSPIIFFIYQLIVAGVELIFLSIKAHKIFPKLEEDQILNFRFRSLMKPIRPVIRYSLTIAFTSSIWVFITQTDKLILSGKLSLAEYGHFTLAVLLASGIMTLCAPITNPLTLRMISLFALGKQEQAIELYKTGTSLVTIFAGSIAIIMILFPQQVLMAWTVNKTTVAEGSLVLSFYSAGYFCCALGAFPGYIQQASGILTYYLRGNILLLTIMVPAISTAAYLEGSTGTAIVWFGIHLIFLICWTWYSHKNTVPGLHRKWFINCILKITLPGVFVGLLFKVFFHVTFSRVNSILELIFIWLCAFLTMVIFSDFVRSYLLTKFNDLVK